MSRGRAIWAAYADTNALAIPCANCGAGHGVWCTKPDGRVSKVPCVARIAEADIAPRTTTAPSTAVESLDFSEPRHPMEDQ